MLYDAVESNLNYFVTAIFIFSYSHYLIKAISIKILNFRTQKNPKSQYAPCGVL